MLVLEPTPASGHDERLYMLPGTSPDSREFWSPGRGELEDGPSRSLAEVTGELGVVAGDVGRLTAELGEAVADRPGVPCAGTTSCWTRCWPSSNRTGMNLARVANPPRPSGATGGLKANSAGARLVKDAWRSPSCAHREAGALAQLADCTAALPAPGPDDGLDAMFAAPLEYG